MVHRYLSDLKLYPTLNIIKYHSEGIYNSGILIILLIYSDRFYYTLKHSFKRLRSICVSKKFSIDMCI